MTPSKTRTPSGLPPLCVTGPPKNVGASACHGDLPHLQRGLGRAGSSQALRPTILLERTAVACSLRVVARLLLLLMGFHAHSIGWSAIGFCAWSRSPVNGSSVLCSANAKTARW
jgi:hypothetical protein